MNTKKIQSILDDKNKLEKFSSMNKLALVAAKEILQRFIDKPETSEEVNSYIFSEKRSKDLKGYVAGEEKGHKRGHELGFVKGAFLGVLVGACIVAVFFLRRK